MLEPERDAWERQPGESAKAYSAFCKFRDAGPQRSIRKAWLAAHPSVEGLWPGSGSISSRWRAWSTRWGWVERASLYDADVDAKKRRAFLAGQLAACERHGRSAAAGLQVVLAPVRLVLEKMANPAFQAELNTLTALALLREARAGLALIPGLIGAERLSLGLTSAVEVEVADRHEANFGDKVLASPRATELLIAAFDEIARPETERFEG